MSTLLRFTAIVLLAAVILGLAHNLWMPALGEYLIRSDAPEPADIGVVLAGDGYGRRILKGGALVRQGHVPAVLVSGPPGMYGYYEDELAIRFAVKHGYPEKYFVRLPNEAHSTGEEADVVLAEVRRRGLRSLLVITSDYHTRRAGRIFRGKAPDLRIRVVGASDEYFRARDWWRSRQSRKTFITEWAKTFATVAGL